MKFKVLVLTMYCGESEFKKCCLEVKKQENVIIKHKIVKNKEELEAHQALFDYWNKNRTKYDYLVKLDADTILASKDIIYKICTIFKKNNNLTGLQVGLKDYYTNCLIAGLTCYSSKISFKIPKNKLFCDRVEEIGGEINYKPNDLLELYPAGYHCKNPSHFQSFHFGFRRYRKNQMEIISKVKDAFLEYKDDPRRFALVGVLAAAKEVNITNTSYNNLNFKELFRKYEKKIKNLDISDEELLVWRQSKNKLRLENIINFFRKN